MASLITSAADLVTHLGISLVSAEKVFAYQSRAEQDLRGILTDAVYDELVTNLPETLPGDDADERNAAQAAFAEGLLSLHHSLSILGFRIADEGGLIKSFGMGDYAGELLSPFQLGQLEKKIHAKAMEAIAALKPALSSLFTEVKDQNAQWQGNGFGFTAVDGNPDSGTYNPRTGVWE